MIITIIVAIVCLVLGGIAGYVLFLHVIKGKYNEMIDTAKKEADVIKEKKLLEVKEKFLNKKAELEQKIQNSLSDSETKKSTQMFGFICISLYLCKR